MNKTLLASLAVLVVGFSVVQTLSISNTKQELAYLQNQIATLQQQNPNVLGAAAINATTTTTTTADAFIKAIPQKIAALQAIQKDPEGFKTKYVKGITTMTPGFLAATTPTTAKMAEGLCLVDIFGQGQVFVYSPYYHTWGFAYTNPTGCPLYTPSSGNMPFVYQ